MKRRHLHRLLGLALAVALLAACSPVYVIRAGFAEARILSRRRPIPRVVADPATPTATREKLELVLHARAFAHHVLGLRVGQSFTTFSRVEHDTLMLVLSAAPKLSFREITWWFPIVGRVPYKGFFDFDEARAQARKLEARGYDAYVRPTSAFSTLGWFNDPLLSTVLRYGDIDLVNTVIHETTHNTIFVPSHVSFNESLANFVGGRGAIDYFCQVEGDAAASCLRARGDWHDDLVFGRFLTGLVHRLEAVYADTAAPPAERLRRRQRVFDEARSRWTTDIEPQLVTPTYRGYGRRMELNNASLIARRLYYDRLDVFEAAYDRMGRDLPATIRAIVAAAGADHDHPFAAVAALAPAPPPR